MDNLNFLRDGRNRLIVGLRFLPTDEEIVFHYLLPKTNSHPLPSQAISEINVFSSDPWELPGNLNEYKYFFNCGNGRQTDMATRSGYWKAIGSTKRIICSKNMSTVGIRRSLVFNKGNNNTRAFKTDWIMHEYCIVQSENSACNDTQQRNSSQGSLVQIGNWTVCRIFQSSIRDVDDDDEPRSCVSDADSSSTSSSSGHCDSSKDTEVSSSIANCKNTSRDI